jgi:large subunit ribosomal protein L25
MEAILEAQARDTFGKNEARRTRRGGQVPGVLYGGDGKGATPIAVQPKALLKILHSESGQNTLISLKLAGAGDNRVLVKDFQLDPITHEWISADELDRAAKESVAQGHFAAASGRWTLLCHAGCSKEQKESLKSAQSKAGLAPRP